MPRDKDFKRVVRTRMLKTGESYTTARASILAKPTSRTTPTSKPAQQAAATPSTDYARLGGKRDELVLEKTGRTWAEWVRELDRRRASEMTHRDLARLIASEYGVSMWWTQTVTVGYERIRGLRAVGQRRDGGFEVNKSKTLHASVDDLFALAADGRRRGRWWPGVKVEARPHMRPPSLRVKHDDGTLTMVWFVAKQPDRTTITVTVSKLPDQAAADATRAAWTGRLERLAHLVS